MDCTNWGTTVSVRCWATRSLICQTSSSRRCSVWNMVSRRERFEEGSDESRRDHSAMLPGRSRLRRRSACWAWRLRRSRHASRKRVTTLSQAVSLCVFFTASELDKAYSTGRAVLKRAPFSHIFEQFGKFYPAEARKLFPPNGISLAGIDPLSGCVLGGRPLHPRTRQTGAGRPSGMTRLTRYSGWPSQQTALPAAHEHSSIRISQSPRQSPCRKVPHLPTGAGILRN